MNDEDAHVFMSKNRRVTIRVGARIPASLLRLLLDDGDSAGAWTLEDGLARATYAPSMSCNYLAVAHTSRFMLLECQPDMYSEYRLVSVGEAPAPGETITSLLCMGVYTPQHQHQSGQAVCVVVGYS
ncbi:hypothetical protein GGF42_004413, partial [Coemansia sp. RSA 2424]